ncbi:hypothetical protein BJ165DRAFT_192946 [Panaeolus papilionaceus]|nr:hypothetical protein BJ165DRAFT_192946 [Panaeolus papilionaceus]
MGSGSIASKKLLFQSFSFLLHAVQCLLEQSHFLSIYFESGLDFPLISFDRKEVMRGRGVVTGQKIVKGIWEADFSLQAVVEIIDYDISHLTLDDDLIRCPYIAQVLWPWHPPVIDVVWSKIHFIN